jgi:formate--tetrahydrofolate ligase
MQTDIEIAQHAKLLPIAEIAARLGIPDAAIEPYGRTKAKVALNWLAGLANR